MRNTENQPQVIPLDHGVDQSRGDRSAQPGTLTSVFNCRIRSGGLQKRPGTLALSAGAGSGSAETRRLADISASFPRPAERAAFICRIGSQRIAGTSAGDAFVRDEAATNAAAAPWTFQGSFSAALPSRRRTGLPAGEPASPAGPYVPACAATEAGYICTASGFGSTLRLTIESPERTVIYRREFAVGAASIITRIAVIGDTFYVCYQGSASTTVTYLGLTVAGGGVSATSLTTLVTLANASSTWDVSSYDSSKWFLVYQSGATTVSLVPLDASAAAGAAATFSTTNNLTYLSVWADSVTARAWVGFVDDPAGTASAQFRVFTAAPSSSLGPTTLASGGTYGPPLFGPRYLRSPAAGDAFYCFQSVSAAGPIALMVGTVATGTATTPVAAAWNFVPLSKPDVQQRVWAMTHLVSNYTTARVCLLRMADASSMNATLGGPAGVVELASPEFEVPGATVHPAAQRARAFHAVALTSDSAGGAAFFAFTTVLTSRTNASSATEPTTRVDVYEYTRYNQEPHRQTVSAGPSRYVSGQLTKLWGKPDVTSGAATGAVEVGFAHGPSIFSVTTTPAGGGLAAGSYVYQALQHWVDAEGTRHLSPASDPVTVTLTAPSSVALKITNCYAGQRLNDAFHTPPPTLVYRTQNGGTNGQLVPIAPAGPGAAWAGYVDATDTVADSIIDDNEFLYTGGGVLPNVLAPSCRYIASSEERLWCGGLWDSNIVECSKIRVPGEPYNFTGHPSHQVVIPGEVNGVAQQDGQVAVFCDDAIYIISGDGPNDQGAGGFAPPRTLVRGIGCPREHSTSIVETEIGIIFRNAYSYYLIPRGFGSPVEIGSQVQAEPVFVLSAAATTTSEHRLARFLVANAGSVRSSNVLVLDLARSHWSRDTYSTTSVFLTGQGFSEIGEWPDGLALMSQSLQRTDNPNVVWAEDEDSAGDAGAVATGEGGTGGSTFVNQYIQTAWQYGPVGQMGWQRLETVSALLEALGDCTLTIQVETEQGSQAPVWSLSTSGAPVFRTVTVQKPNTYLYRVSLETSGETASAGVRFMSLGFAVAPLGGMRPPLNDTERQ